MSERLSVTADIELTEKGRQYAEAHTKAPGSPAGALLPFRATKRRRIGKTILAALRKELAARIEEAIAMLDLLDGDSDDEPWLGPAQGGHLNGWKAGGNLEGDELDHGEEDRSDEEPSLGSDNVRIGSHDLYGEEFGMNQMSWGEGSRGDDMEGVDEDGVDRADGQPIDHDGPKAAGAAEEARRLLAKVPSRNLS